jgi:hypothetical protein
VRVPFRLNNSEGSQSTPFLDGEEQQEGEFALHHPDERLFANRVLPISYPKIQ